MRLWVSCLRLAISLIFLLSLFAGFGVGAGNAQAPTAESINHSRGLSVTSAYQLDGLDAVNLFSGNLTLALPLGGDYPVSDALSYRFTLRTNSNVWDFEPVNRNGFQETIAEPDSDFTNAGLGWSLSFGRLFAPSTPGINDSPTTWLLVEGDGSRRTFSGGLHSWSSSATASFAYTRDGSYLRMKKLASNEREVESPDGTIRVFRTDGWLRQVRDRFGNSLNLAYDLNFLTWTLSDSTGRSQIVTFESDPTDPEPVIALKRKRLKTLDLAAFAGTRALYTFNYSRVFIDRSPKDSSPTTGPQVEVSLLDSIALPDTSQFSMTYIRTAADKRNTFEETGSVRSLTLPTLGKLEWEYSLYLFPTEQQFDEQGNPIPFPWGTGTGVRFKRTIDRGGVTLGTWTYQQGGRPPTQPASSNPAETRTWVTDPLGHQAVHYFKNETIDYGLPYTRLLGDGTRFLSQEIFDGTATTSSRKRSVYLLYEKDDPTSGNERIASERTVFHDDGGLAVVTDRSNFDGFGNYRTTVTSDTFASPGVLSRTVFVNYNPARGTYGTGGFSMWPTGSAWILDTLTEQTVTEGSVTAKQQLCFEATTGYLQRERIYKGTTPGSTDVVRVYTRNAAGQTTQVQHYEGDVQTVGTAADLCTLTLPSSDQHRVAHTYQNGVLATSQYRTSTGGNLGFFHVDRTIDLNTGQVATERDISGLVTDLEYDALGRRTWIKPAATSGIDRDGWVEFVYLKAAGASKAEAKIRQRGTGAKTRPILAEGRVLFDDFGRITEERSKLATGVENRRQTFYNALGHRSSVSEAGPATGTLFFTAFNNYDPFGRPRQIAAPDGKTVTVAYQGVRRQDRTVTIGTSRNATTGAINESSVTNRQIFDRHGRMVSVTENTGGTTFLTEYFYDIGNRLNRVKQVRSGVTQERKFTYDHRGFLTQEQQPEKGSLGNGFVTYSSYGPLGQTGRRQDGPNDLTFTYDRAARVTQIRDTLGLLREQKAFVYATANGASDRRAGKMLSATRHNYFDEFSTDLAITETYTYGGREGRVSVRATGVSSGDSYSQGFTWNELGDPATVTYPDCIHCLPGIEPARTVSYGYTNGFLTSVSGFASSITYHPNGMIDQMTYPSGVAWTQGLDPKHMRRPASISVTQGAASLFATGAYDYDGSGNVVKMGTDYYLYDVYGRLIEGTAFQAGANRKQTYAYDGFGNLTTITTWFNGTPTARTVATNPGTNRLSAAGYDAAGAMTSWGTYTYERDSLEMIRALKGGGLDLRYAYTADDERFLEFDVSTFNRVWKLRDLEGKVIREMRLAGNGSGWSWQKDWILREGQPLAAVDAVEGTRYLHPDHLGTTRAITDTAGVFRTSYHFYPFGELAAKSGASTEMMLYTGHERDEHTGLAGGSGTTDDLDYMHARYYNPMLGRFLRVDPVRSEISTLPGTWNRYSYGAASPLKFTDPDGKALNLAAGGIGALIGGAFGAIGETAAQLIENGGNIREINLRDVGAAALGGAVSGGLAGLTLGTSLVVESGALGIVAVAATANATGGVVTRAVDSSESTAPLDGGSLALDSAIGAAGGVVGSKVEKIFTRQADVADRIAEASVPAAGRGDFGASRSVRGNRARATRLRTTGEIAGIVAGAKTTNVAAPVVQASITSTNKCTSADKGCTQ